MRTVSTTPPPVSKPDPAPQSVSTRADAVIDRTEAMLRMMALGMSLDEIEQQLDWLDAQAKLKQS
jgi:hypothetical protein